MERELREFWDKFVERRVSEEPFKKIHKKNILNDEYFSFDLKIRKIRLLKKEKKKERKKEKKLISLSRNRIWIRKEWPTNRVVCFISTRSTISLSPGWPPGCSNAVINYLLFYYYVPRIHSPSPSLSPMFSRPYAPKVSHRFSYDTSSPVLMKV